MDGSRAERMVREAGRVVGGAGRRGGRRRLMLHDAGIFAVLVFVAVSLGGVTLVLFRSFEAYREHLGQVWVARGRAALAAGRTEEGVAALRTGLGYARSDAVDEVLLAEGLLRMGRREEARNRFEELLEERPGDGRVNLGLARIARAEGKGEEAMVRYGAALSGSWEGDGRERRQAVRAEVAAYLAERPDLAGAGKDWGVDEP